MADEQIRQRILDAAGECLLHAGPTARIHHLIAERAGVSRPTLYKHLGDQKAIIEALLHRELDRFLACARTDLTHGGSPRERFVDMVVYAVGYARRHTLLQKILREQPQIVLPWLTTNAATAFEHVLAFMTPHLEAEPGGADQKLALEWQARLAISLFITPSPTTRLDDPGQLRRHLSALFDLGHAPAPA
ncbi:TetR/AcrR family transcriptional regulator [Nonomuraea longicatena]|uniref:HTH tetR-type domain-containing protein n=1 Tax=Nonomuraea longicatena TaxID=83682 RepID=A0ABP4BLR5_9ACTN